MDETFTENQSKVFDNGYIWVFSQLAPPIIDFGL
jgi:hypothetical protein